MASSNWLYQKIRYMTYEELRKLPNSEILTLINKSADYAEKRRDKVVKKFVDTNMPTPQSYKVQSNQLDNQRRSKLSKTQKKAGEEEFQGWADYNFRVTKDFYKVPEKDKRNYLIWKFKRNQQFLRNKTSTVYGVTKTLDKFSERLKEQGVDVNALLEITTDDEKYKALWQAYNKVTSEYTPNMDTTLTSGEMQKRIVEYIAQGKSAAQAAGFLKSALKQKYEPIERKRSKKYDDGISSFDGDDDNGFTTNKL